MPRQKGTPPIPLLSPFALVSVMSEEAPEVIARAPAVERVREEPVCVMLCVAAVSVTVPPTVKVRGALAKNDRVNRRAISFRSISSLIPQPPVFPPSP